MVSYLSTPYKPEPYVQPMDLNFMAKVLSTEQSKFDEEGKKIQNQIDQFGSLDVIKGVDKEYLNNKINNLVTGLNDLGGVNLIDQNVATKIEGLGSDIYGDNNIVNAVAATRQIRSLQASYDNLKTNPKLTKYYSESNEWNDNKAVNSYLSSNKVGDTYYGKTSATQYVPYRDNLSKAINGIKANVSTNVTPDGVSYVTQEGKIVTPERIIATASDLLLPEEKAQMERDGMYAFKDADPLALVQQSLDLNNQKLQDAQTVYNKYQVQALAAGNDTEAHQKYLDLMGQEANNINQLTAASKTIQSQGLQTYSQNPDAYKAQVYKDQFYRGLGERYGYSETTAKISSNPAALLQLKMQQQEEQFNQRMMFNAIKEGLGYVVDPVTGKVTLTGTKTTTTKGKTPFDDSTLAPVSISDKNDPDLYKKTEQQFINKNTELETKKSDLFNNYWQQYLNDHPDISQLLQSTQSGTGVNRSVIGQNILETTNSKPGLQLEDLNFDPNSLGVTAMANRIKGANPKLSFDEAKTKVLALRQIYENYDKLSHLDHNPNADVNKIDPKLSSIVEQYQLINEEQSANNSKVKGINDAIANSAGLTESEKALYNDYSQNPGKYITEQPQTKHAQVNFLGTLPSPSSTTSIDPRIEAIKDKIANANIDEKSLKNAYYNNISNRPVYEHQVLTEDNPLVKDKYIQGLMSTILRDRGSSDNSISPSDVKKHPLNLEDIHPQEIGRNQAGTGYAVTGNIKIGEENKQAIYKTVSVDLEPAQAQQLGLDTDPYKALNDAVFLNGSTNPLLIAAKGINGTLVTKIRIVKNDLTDRTSQEAHPQIVVQDGNNTKYINIPNITGNTPSEVYATMKTYIEQFAQRGLTLPQIVEQLKQYNQ